MSIYPCAEQGCPGSTNDEGGYCWNCKEAAERHFGVQDSPDEFPDSKQKRKVVDMGKRAICKHCNREMNITGRGLCFTCYQKHREEYPKSARGGGMPKKAKEPTTERQAAEATLIVLGYKRKDLQERLNSLSEKLTAEEMVKSFLKKDEPEQDGVGDIEPDAATEYFDAVQDEPELSKPAQTEITRPEEPIDADFFEVVEIEIKTDRDAKLLEKIVKLAESTRRTPGDWMLCAVEEYLAAAVAD